MDFLHILKLSVFFFLPESFSFTKKKSIKNETKKIIGDIDYVIGADLFLKNDKFALFDETFILYYEDSDLQLLMKENGLRRILIDGPKIQHLEHKSNKFNKKIDFFKSFGKINSMLSAIIYTKKHLNSKGLIFLLKFLTVLDFLNPFLFKKTKFYIKKIIKL